MVIPGSILLRSMAGETGGWSAGEMQTGTNVNAVSQKEMDVIRKRAQKRSTLSAPPMKREASGLIHVWAAHLCKITHLSG